MPFSLEDSYLNRQQSLVAKFREASSLQHGTTVGDATEAGWRSVLKDFLPKKYGVSSGFIIDSFGGQSDQIDIIIHDQQYSPLFLRTPPDNLVIPAESVYAVFEVKQSLNKDHVRYASDKINSVRSLQRTSAPIKHAGGVYAARDPESLRILGGILTTRLDWVDISGAAAKQALLNHDDNRRVDIGCALESKSFDISASGDIEFSPSNMQLIFFVMRLYKKLQALGSNLSPNLDRYEALALRALISH